MTAVSILQVARDNFSRKPDTEGVIGLLRLQVSAIASSVAVGVIVWLTGGTLPPSDALLTATAILTGITFTMALRFSERSIDSRRDPFTSIDGAALNFIDNMRSLLVWITGVGVCSTLVLALTTLYSQPIYPVVVFVAVALFVYTLLLVMASLYLLHVSTYQLR